jgi:hypothetical protein
MLPDGKEPAMEALAPASPDSLPLLGELIADEPFWRYPVGPVREGVTHLRVWLTAGTEPGHLAVITETGTAAGITESTEHIWIALARRYGPSLVLLEHPAPETGEGGHETNSGWSLYGKTPAGGRGFSGNLVSAAGRRVGHPVIRTIQVPPERVIHTRDRVAQAVSGTAAVERLPVRRESSGARLGTLWILMRLIEAWNRRPLDDLSSVSSPGTVTRLSGTARRRRSIQ